MQTMLLFAAKVIIYSAVFFVYYCLSLRNKRFHYYNRFYLLMAVLLSLTMPFINITVWEWHSSSQQVIQLFDVMKVNSFEVVATGKSSFFELSDLAPILYSVLALYLLLALSFSIIRLIRFKKKFGVEKIEDVNFINTDLEQAPFSFLNDLFWKSSLDINTHAGRQIFTHELTHIRQKHSWDKLFLRVTTALFWFNPFYWLIQKELSLLHEFIADEKAIEDKSAEAFAMMILQSQYAKNIFSPAQSFHYSPIKRRLLMLTTSSHTSYSYARRIMVLPLLAITVLFFAFRLKNDSSKSNVSVASSPFVLVVDAGHGGTDNGAPGINNELEKNINLSIANKLLQLAPAYGITVKMTRTDDATLTLQNRIDFIEQQKPDACISIHVNNSPGQTDRNEIDAFITRNEKISSYQESRLLGSGLLQNLAKDFSVETTLHQRKDQGIYVLDNNTYPAVLLECGYMNNPENIKLLMTDAGVEKIAKDILQGVAAFANADKENLQNAAGAMSKKDTSLPDTTAKKAPLYLVNDKETSVTDAEAINAATIQSMNVLKGDEVTIKKYGDKAANGVVLITLKTPSALQAEKAGDDTENQSQVGADKHLADSLLIVLDGNIITPKEMYLMSPNDIESISVLKEEQAVHKYGEKGRKGAVEITSKKATGKQVKQTDTEKKSPANEHYEKVFTKTEVPPSFPGGEPAWQTYLANNVNAGFLTKKKAPAGEYKVIVSFMVADDGTVSDVKALNDPGYGAGTEAIHIITKGPKWIPAMQNGHKVIATARQEIRFLVK